MALSLDVIHLPHFLFSLPLLRAMGVINGTVSRWQAAVAPSAGVFSEQGPCKGLGVGKSRVQGLRLTVPNSFALILTGCCDL